MRSDDSKPRIDQSVFSSITIAGQVFAHDVLIRRNGRVKRRKKRLSKDVYGTSHVLSLAEAKHIYEQGTSRLIIGSGQAGNVQLSKEAAASFGRKRCQVELLPTPETIVAWNDTEDAVIGLFHVTY